ncbi:alpha/beta hydrolase fold domain-containing protein [Fangia hongkongensis]|uniref:alpha/beta hydrolase fold domain-containing protein n=2 Tax=Fangia hongkongensis TaxID=270495 RepID=UPI0003627088|nr:alpha/beta hydrolase fold domain-containing protein [Fangia hongkongensis]
MWAITGSSGFEDFDEFEIIERLPRETPFGLCSNGFYRIKIADKEALFLCRTGQNESLLPDKINYRANIYALKKHGATAILALSSVRSLLKTLAPGDMVIPYQYIDRTKGVRQSTFCDDGLLAYVSLTHPISEEIADTVKKHKDQFDFKMHFGQAYTCIDGPQFPTMIDARCYQTMGAGVMGMTAFPEFALAREAGMHYLPCNFIVDYVPWSDEITNNDCILQTRIENYDKAKNLILWVLENLTQYEKEDCNDLGIAGSISSLSDKLTPRQSSWFDVLARSNAKRTYSKAFKAEKLTLYHGTKAIPEKLQNLLSFVNKYRTGTDYKLDSIRKSAASLMLYAGKVEEIASVRDFSIKGADHDIPVRLYHPNPAKRLPIIVYTHGGGFVSGTLDGFDAPCRSLAKATNCVVVAVDYRLAPEHQYPAGFNDVYTVAKWAFEHAADIKATNEKFAMIGDSAGGNYTALCVNKAAKTGDFVVSDQVLIYPTTDLSHETASMEEFAQGYLLEAKQVLWNQTQYLPEKTDLRAANISPLYEENLSNIPRTFVFTAGYDPLRDEGLLYAQKLLKAGVQTHHYHFDNMIHAFINFAKIVPQETAMLYERIDKFLRLK